MICAGVEVRPGKPYTHSYNSSHGRLRICQVARTPPFYFFYQVHVLFDSIKVMFCLAL